MTTEREPHFYQGATYEVTAMLYCLVMGCLSPPEQQHQLVPAQEIDLDYHPVFEPVDKYRRTTAEIIADDGYPCEVHHVITEDGYVLEMVRIKREEINTAVSPVLFVHGLLCISAIWVWTGKDMSLPYMLADMGVEVWLGTFRGGRGSDRHVRLSVSSDQYWAFSYDHIAKFDIPAMINYALDTSASDTINYVGHSMGGSTYFAMCNYKPDICKQKVNLMVGLGTHTVIHHMMSPAPKFLAKKYEKLHGRFWFQEMFGLRDFQPSPDIMREMAALFCTESLHSAGLCRMGIFLIVGPTDLNITRDTLGYIAGEYPSTTSVMLLEQYTQFIARKQWAKFDYGRDQNLYYYGTEYPPVYSLSHVTTPVALISSEWDMLCSALDTKIMSLEMPNLVYEKKMNKTWYNHCDFYMNADNAELFNTVIELVHKKYKVQDNMLQTINNFVN